MSHKHPLTQDEIVAMTRQLGEAWAYPHVRRVLALAERIAGDLVYQPQRLWYAAYLHDWGAFPAYRQPGVEHALRSRQVAEADILPRCELNDESVAVVLDAIERHDLRDPRPVTAPEALILREADFLDFLGPLGAAKELAWGPNDLPRLLERIRERVRCVRGRFTLPAAQVLAEQRIAETEILLNRIEEDSLGFL